MSVVFFMDMDEYTKQLTDKVDKIIDNGVLSANIVNVEYTEPSVDDSLKVPNNKNSSNTTLQQTDAPYSYKTQQVKRIDRRVSLNVAPVTFDASGNYNGNSFADRVAYVLGKETTNLNGTNVYGFLRSCLSDSCGLVFPYTPNITINHQVNYDKTDITHSNLSLNHYKNTPPPSYTVDAVFTADSRENALHMLSAIWFLRAVTKCDFGEHSTTAGTPPPVLYLNGYNQMMDNIPVVVKSFSYSLPKDKDYVPLGINLDSGNFIYNDREVYSDSNGKIYEGKDKPSESGGMQYINGLATALDNMKSGKTTLPSNRYNSFYFNTWLPMEMSFNISLEVQPNLLKHKKVFDLNTYKMGIYNLGEYKDKFTVYRPTSTGLGEANVTIEYTMLGNAFRNSHHAEDIKEEFENRKFNNIEIRDEADSQNILANKIITAQRSMDIDMKKLSSFGMTDKTYKFNKSGFTW